MYQHSVCVVDQSGMNIYHSKHETLTQCCCSVDPASQTLDQHYSNTVSTLRFFSPSINYSADLAVVLLQKPTSSRRLESQITRHLHQVFFPLARLDIPFNYLIQTKRGEGITMPANYLCWYIQKVLNVRPLNMRANAKCECDQTQSSSCRRKIIIL